MNTLNKVSIIIPVYNSEKTIGQLCHRLLSMSSPPHEIVLINDGSQDSSHKVCTDLQEELSEIVTYIELSRNYGEHNAVMAGLHYCTGDYAVIMDDDFQNPPEEVLKLVEKMKNDKHDVVYSAYPQKKHNWFRNLGSAFNDFVATILLQKPKDLYLSSFKCLNRFLIDEIIKYDGPYPYIDGLIFRITNRYGIVEVRHEGREEGESGYTFTKLVRLWMNMFVNFSLLPLRCASLLGFMTSGFALLYTLHIVFQRLIGSETPEGWATTTALVALLAGVQLSMIGLLGEYVGRIFLSQNKTPQFCVRGFSSKKDVNKS